VKFTGNHFTLASKKKPERKKETKKETPENEKK
jgi:hypothetical protein